MPEMSRTVTRERVCVPMNATSQTGFELMNRFDLNARYESNSYSNSEEKSLFKFRLVMFCLSISLSKFSTQLVAINRVTTTHDSYDCRRYQQFFFTFC